MKKTWLVVIAVAVSLFVAGPVFANGNGNGGNGDDSIHHNVINKNDIDIKNKIKTDVKTDVKTGDVNIENERPLPNQAPVSTVELHFGQDGYGVYTNLPSFGQIQTTPFDDTKERIVKVVYKMKKVRLHELYEEILEGADVIMDKFHCKAKVDVRNVRMVVLNQDGQRVWNTGGNLSGGGSFLGGGNAGGSGTVGMIPSMGETYANPRFTIIWVEVASK